MGRPREVKDHLGGDQVTIYERRLSIEVLQAVADGNTYANIAAEKGLSESWVKRLIVTLFDEWGIDNRAHAVAMGFRKGLIS
jgi:DNA-binding NarL/FixJ family response regulator